MIQVVLVRPHSVYLFYFFYDGITDVLRESFNEIKCKNQKCLLLTI